MCKMSKIVFLLVLVICLSVYILLPVHANSFLARSEGLILYLSFDEGGDKVIKDLSGNGHDGENHGAKPVEGKYGKALEYSGVDTWIIVPDAPDLNFGPKDSLTAICWVKILGAPSGQGNLLAKYAVGAGTTPFYGMFHNVNNKVHAYIRDKNSKLVESWSKDVINDGNWHHLALIRDADKKKVFLYVDGNLDSDKDDIAEDLTNEFPLAIGRHTSEFLIGAVDEAMLFRRALSSDEAKASMEPQKFLSVSSRGKTATMWGEIKLK